MRTPAHCTTGRSSDDGRIAVELTPCCVWWDAASRTLRSVVPAVSAMFPCDWRCRHVEPPAAEASCAPSGLLEHVQQVDDMLPRPRLEDQSARSGQPGSAAQVFQFCLQALQPCFFSLTFHMSNNVCKISPSGWAVLPQCQQRFLRKCSLSQGFWALYILFGASACARNPGFRHSPLVGAARCRARIQGLRARVLCCVWQ